MGRDTPIAWTQATVNPYIAGFFDGEGSASIIIVHRKGIPKADSTKQTLQFRPYLKLSQKYRFVLDTIRKKLGYGFITGNQNNGYRWQVSSRDSILDLINRILPYSIVKHDSLLVIREFIEFQKARLVNSFPYTKVDLETMIGLRSKLLSLNEITRAKQLKRIVYDDESIRRQAFVIDDIATWDRNRRINAAFAMLEARRRNRG